MSDLVLATRGSRLALEQAEMVARRLREAHPGAEVSLLEVSAAGDADTSTPIDQLGVGAFVRAIQHAVLEGRADLAVHSCKDLPTDGPDGLVTAYPERLAPWDVLCGSTVDDLRRGARVGTGSPRRRAQLLALRPDVTVVDIRGNVPTRIDRVSSGDLDAVVLAEAGLARLGLEDAADHRFSVDDMVPAPGQGVIAVEAPGGSEAATLMAAIDDAAARTAAESERALLAATGAGCRSALGAYADVDVGGILMHCFVEDEDGPRRAAVSGSEPGEVAEAARRELRL